MFAPDHEAVAGELARVTAPGGRIALANWTPASGGLSELFKIMGKYQPSPPPSSPFDWGDEQRVTELLGGSFDLELETHVSPLTSTPARITGSCSRRPTARRRHSSRRSATGAMSSGRDWVEYFEENHRTDDGVIHEREYLLVLGRRR